MIMLVEFKDRRLFPLVIDEDYFLKPLTKKKGIEPFLTFLTKDYNTNLYEGFQLVEEGGRISIGRSYRS